MIRAEDLREAIAECQGERNPNAQTCMKLAAYYTILRELEPAPAYSYEKAPNLPPVTQIGYSSDSEFGRAISGKNEASVWELIEELVSTVQVIQPRLYNGFMRKLNEL